MKAINYKIIFFSFICLKDAIEICKCPEKALRLQKKLKNDKTRKLINFFCGKFRVKASKFITHFLKTLNFLKPIPFVTFRGLQ